MSPDAFRELINRRCLAEATMRARRLEDQARVLIACGYRPDELVIRVQKLPGVFEERWDVVPASAIEGAK